MASLGLAIAYALGVSPVRLGALALVTYQPLPAAVLLGVLIWKTRSDPDGRAALFCEGVASEVRAGATLRNALISSATSVGGAQLSSRQLRADVPMAQVADIIGDAFPEIGDELRLVIVNAHASGSDVAGLFDEMGSLAIAQSEIRREIRVATAPGKMTAAVLVGAPTIFVMSQLASGGLGELLATSEQRVVALLGLALFGTGLAMALLVTWRAGA